MFEAQKDLDLPQGALAVRLVLKGADLLDGHTDFVVSVIGGTEKYKRKMTFMVYAEAERCVKQYKPH